MQLPPPLKVPLSVLKVIPPVGVVAPAPAVSVTVAVQVVVPFTGVDVGVQLTLVLVDRAVVVTLALPLLAACVLSPPDEAAIVCGPTTVAVYVTEQRPVASSVQLPPPLKVPLSVLKVICPVGVVAPVPPVSVTVAVQVVAPFTGAVVGVQLTFVLVDRAVVVTLALPLLAVCVLSPPDEAAIVCGPTTVAV